MQWHNKTLSVNLVGVFQVYPLVEFHISGMNGFRRTAFSLVGDETKAERDLELWPCMRKKNKKNSKILRFELNPMVRFFIISPWIGLARKNRLNKKESVRQDLLGVRFADL